MPLRFRVPVRFPDPLAADEDRALVRRFAEAHDEAAFSGLVHRHARMVFGVCRRTVGDQHLAEDAFQAVFLVLARNPRRAVAASSVGGWLFGIARRVGLTARRHELRRQQHLTDFSGKKKEDSKPDFDDLLRVLDEELTKLSATYRDPLVACFLEERTQDEAARHLGWSLSTLRRRLERGKELLRTRLLRRGVTLAAGLFVGGLASSAFAALPSRLLDASVLVAHPSPLAEVLVSKVVRGMLPFQTGIAAMVVVVAIGGMAAAIGFWQPEKFTGDDSGAVSHEGLIARFSPIRPRFCSTSDTNDCRAWKMAIEMVDATLYFRLEQFTLPVPFLPSNDRLISSGTASIPGFAAIYVCSIILTSPSPTGSGTFGSRTPL
jgi:RNA polymerase sigma factor (sigma-70 family)